MDFNKLEYKRPDLNQFKQNVQTIIEALQDSKSEQETKELFLQYDQLSGQVIEMLKISSIRHTIDTRDEFYKNENDFWDENTPKIQEIAVEFLKVILTHPHRNYLEETFGKIYFQIAENSQKIFKPEIMEDLVKENQLTSQYAQLKASAQIPFNGETYTLAQLGPFKVDLNRETRKAAMEATFNFFKENEAEFDRIYDELVKVRTIIAKKLGFNTFTELGYIRMNRLDYNQTMVETYRKQILKYVVPVVSELSEKQKARLNYDHLYYYDSPINFLDGNAKPILSASEILEAGREMYHELSPETAEFIDLMLDNNLMDTVAKPGKMAGGYMDILPVSKLPFIFSNFNGTSDDIDVLTHEVGHAFQGYQSRNIVPSDLIMPTFESCEIHSMSMEFLTWPYMNKFFGDKADRYRYTHLIDSIKFLPYGVCVDHFQHEVYNNPNLTPDERKSLWAKLEKTYRPSINYENNEFLNKGTYWFSQGHIFESPFYYIDYTLAQVCAFQFLKRTHIDHDPKAWEDYLNICQIGGTQSFTQIVESAHLQSPFVDGALEDTIHSLKNYLDSIDDQSL